MFQIAGWVQMSQEACALAVGMKNSTCEHLIPNHEQPDGHVLPVLWRCWAEQAPVWDGPVHRVRGCILCELQPFLPEKSQEKGQIEMKPIKPLAGPAYGSIPHLPGSRRGPGDHGINEGQLKILTVGGKRGTVVVEEKLDGSCVAVARIGDSIFPLIRAGYLAKDSKFEQHWAFHEWAMQRGDQFMELLESGERVVGEWLWQAHGTRYVLPHEPFVAFDLMRGRRRETRFRALARLKACGLVVPRLIHMGGPIPLDEVIKKLDFSGHGAIDPVEGAVFRFESDGEVEFLAKWVRPGKEDGKYLEIQNTTGEVIRNLVAIPGSARL